MKNTTQNKIISVLWYLVASFFGIVLVLGENPNTYETLGIVILASLLGAFHELLVIVEKGFRGELGDD